MERYAVLQLSLLNSAAKLLKDNGGMVYSTCSVMRAENEDVVGKFLAENPDFELAVPESFKFRDVISPDKYLRTYPGLRYFDNIFAAYLRRRG